MKKRISLLLLMLMMVSVVSFAADDEEEVFVNYQGLRFHRTAVKKSLGLGVPTVTVIFKLALPESGQYSGDIVIPQKIPYHYEVDGHTSFMDEPYHIVIEEVSVTAAEFSFAGNTEITSVTYPAVFEISSFQGCTSLQSVVFPSQTASYAPGQMYFYNMPQSMFKGCEKLCSVSNFDKFEIIRESTFEGCKMLQDVDLSNAKTIEKSAFLGCESLKSVYLPNIKEIYSSAFENCTSLEYVEFGNQFKLLGGVFSGCTNLTKVIGLEKMLKTNTSYYVMPEAMFKNCKSLVVVTFPNVDFQIRESAFEGCEQLKEIGGDFTIERTIGKAAFKGCKSLETLPVDWKQKHYYNEAVFSGCHNLVFGDTLKATSCSNSAFYECYKLKAVEMIGSNDYSIEDFAFYDCQNLTSFSAYYKDPDVYGHVFNLGLGDKVFYNCQNLYHFNCWIGKVGDQTFYNCNKLPSVVICNKGSGRIGEQAFYGCASLDRLTLFTNGSNLTGDNAFQDCYNLADVFLVVPISSSQNEINSSTFPYSVFQESKLHFAYDHVLADQYMEYIYNRGWRLFKNKQFDYCGISLTNSDKKQNQLIYRQGVYYKLINGALVGYYDTECIIPQSVNDHYVTRIGSKAFKDNHWVETIHLPISIRHIDSLAFNNCQELKSLYVRRTSPIRYPTGLQFEKNRRKRPFEGIDFDNCTLYVPKNCYSKYRSANEWKRFKHIVETDDEGGVWNPPSGGSSPLDQIVEFDDPLTEDICLEHWDTNETEALSYREAKAVNDIGTVFQGTDISAFCELQYFTGVKAVAEKAFMNCVALDSICIPNSVRNIGDQAFAGCNAMTKVITLISEPFAFNDNVFTQTVYSTATLVVPVGTKAKYQTTAGWENFRIIIEEGENVSSVKPGDLTGDEEVNGMDLVALVNQIMGQQEQTDDTDINGDGEVNGMDYVALVNIIMAAPAQSRDMTAARNEQQLLATTYAAGTSTLSIEPFDIKAGETKTMLIDMSNPDQQVTMVEFYIQLPEGLTVAEGEDNPDIAGRTTWKKHSLYMTPEGNTSHIMLASATNQLLSGNSGAIISIQLMAGSGFNGGTITLKKQIIGSPDMTESRPADYSYTIKGGDTPPAGDFIVFADAIVEKLCLYYWDTNKDGKLTKQEAAAVTSLGDVFCLDPTKTKSWQGSDVPKDGLEHVNFTSFDELQYFTGLNSIDEGAFYGQQSLQSVTLPASIRTIGKYAFYYCWNLKAINVPNSVETIGEGAFYSCKNAASLVLGSSVKTIGNAAFRDCGKLIEVTIPEGCTNIGGSAFLDCAKLTKVTLPATLKDVGSYLFAYAEQTISIHLGSRDLWQQLNIVYLADDNEDEEGIVEQSDYRLYYNGQELTEVELPQTMTSIGNNFKNCQSIKSLTIPKTMTSLAVLAFNGCRNLTSVTSYVENPFYIEDAAFEYTDPNTHKDVFTSATLYVPKGTKAKYQSQYGWKNFKNIVETDTDGIDTLEHKEPFDVHTLSGQTVKCGVTSLNQLPKGIYIVNGHIVAIK